MDCAISSQAVMVHYVFLITNIENGLSILPEMPTWNVPSKNKFLAFTVLYSHGALKGMQE